MGLEMEGEGAYRVGVPSVPAVPGGDPYGTLTEGGEGNSEGEGHSPPTWKVVVGPLGGTETEHHVIA